MSYQCESGFTLIPLHGGLSGLSGLHHCTGLHWLGWSSGSSLSGSQLCLSLGSQCIILWCGGQFDTIITGELLGNALIDVWYHRLRLAAVQHHKNTLHTYYSPSPSHPQQNVIKLQRVGQHSTLNTRKYELKYSLLQDVLYFLWSVWAWLWLVAGWSEGLFLFVCW